MPMPWPRGECIATERFGPSFLTAPGLLAQREGGKKTQQESEEFKDFKVSTMHEGKRLLDIFLVLYVLAVLCPGRDG